jgi:copper chaperone CopZ
MKTRVYSPDIECDSCVKVLGRALNKTKGIKSFKITTEYIDVEHAASTKKKDILTLIRNKGYRAALTPQLRAGIHERTKDFFTNKKKYAIEWKMLSNIAFTFLILAVLETILVFAKPELLRFAPWLLYLTISVVFIAGALWHYRAYKTTVTCMTGMMIGMTIGMQTGMLIGAVIGVTNGFFPGATIGMLLGSIIGILAGKCCGVMGAMEGLMSGIMGGTMGAMITVMMYFEDFFPSVPDIHVFMPIYVALNVAVLIGFSYMLFEELVEGKDVHVEPASFTVFFLWTFLALAALSAIVIFAPHSVFLR